MRSISNLNSVLVKNYAPGSDTLAIIRELKKLGIIKSVAKAKGKSKAKMIEDIKQPSDMVGYTKTLGGSAAVSTNQFPLRQIEAGMSQNQIEDIQRRNDATVAALRGEVQQQRLQDIEAQQGQRFEDITKLGGIMNPLLERFRGSTFPAQATGSDPIDPFANRRPGVILLGDVPDVQEERFTESLNEGGPEAVEQQQTEVIASEEPETIEVPAARIQPQQKIGGGRAELPEGVAFAELLGTETQKRREGIRAEREKKEITKQQVADQFGLGKIPTKSSSKKAVTDFYIALTDAMGESEITNATKEEYLAEINKLLEIARNELTV